MTREKETYMTGIAKLREMIVIVENNTYRRRVLQSSDQEDYLETMRENCRESRVVWPGILR